jgi:hypothetical protein
MHPSALGSSLVSSSHLLSATWENALCHFRRALMECGSSLDTEHSQRIGLLFSKPVGDTEELKKWASIFDAEAVPTTALILKALVNHNQWNTAIQLLELNKDGHTTKELCEVLAQSLVQKGLWQETLSLISILRPSQEVQNFRKSLQPIGAATSSTVENVNDDSYQMATNPTFLPEEARPSYCGFAAAVARGFPRRQDWEKALTFLGELRQLTDSQTGKRLFEYEIARLVHDAHHYEEVVNRSRTNVPFHTSPSLLRSLLHCALALRDAALSIQCLESLCSFGSRAVSTKMFEQACQLFISNDADYDKGELLRFEAVVCHHAHLIQRLETQKTVSVFCADYDLKIPIFISGNCNAAAGDSRTPALSIAKSVTQLDRAATLLLSQGRWKEALHVADKIKSQIAQNDDEDVVIQMLRDNCNSWERTLQFFSA